MRAYGASVIGPSHVKKKMPNQDAVGIDQANRWLIVSDGHGGEAHLYSEIGSRLAVSVTDEVLKERYESLRALSWVQQRAVIESDICKAIVDNWRKAVLEHKVAYDRAEEVYPLYGCTLLVAIRFESHVFFIQIGDGAVMVIEKGGVIYPVPDDELLFGNFTTSLSDENAVLEMRVAHLPIKCDTALIGLFTDGVENAYRGSLEDASAFGMQLLQDTETEPLEPLLTKALQDAAAHSLDDTTGAVWRFDGDFSQYIGLTQWPVKTVSGTDLLTLRLSRMALNKRLEWFRLWCDALGSWDWLTTSISFKQLRAADSGMLLPIEGEGRTLDLDERFEKLCEWITPFLPKPMVCQDLKALKDALMAMSIGLRYCYVCQHFSVDNALSCSLCQTPHRETYTLQTSGYAFDLFYNTKLNLHHIMPLKGSYNPDVAEVRQHPKHPEVWGIKNIGITAWQVIGVNQSIRSISPGETLSLKKGLTLYIHGLPIKII